MKVPGAKPRGQWSPGGFETVSNHAIKPLHEFRYETLISFLQLSLLRGGSVRPI